MTQFPKIITSWINAGGAGKTLVLKTLAERLAQQGFKVGMIDSDNQCGTQPTTSILGAQYVLEKFQNTYS